MTHHQSTNIFAKHGLRLTLLPLLYLPFVSAMAESPLEVLPKEVTTLQLRINQEVVDSLDEISVKAGDKYQLTASFPKGAQFAFFNFTDWQHRLSAVSNLTLLDQTGNESCRLNEFDWGSYVWCRKIDAPEGTNANGSDGTDFIPKIIINGVVNTQAEAGKDYKTLLAYSEINNNKRWGNSQWVRSTLQIQESDTSLQVGLISTSPEENDFGITPLIAELEETRTDVKGVKLTFSFNSEIIDIIDEAANEEPIEKESGSNRPTNQPTTGGSNGHEFAGDDPYIHPYLHRCGGQPVIRVDRKTGTLVYEARAISDGSNERNQNNNWDIGIPPYSEECNGGPITEGLAAICIENGQSPVTLTEALLDIDGSSRNGDWSNTERAKLGAKLMVNCQAVTRYIIQTEEDSEVGISE